MTSSYPVTSVDGSELTDAEWHLWQAPLHAIAEPLSYREKQSDALAAREKRERRAPKLHSQSLAFAPLLLKSSLFKAGKGARQIFTEHTVVVTHDKVARLTYKGTQLGQDDLRVLLALLKLQSGQNIDNLSLITPRKFCRENLGWADSSSSVDKLATSLSRLKSAHITLTRECESRPAEYSLVSSFEPNARGPWAVELSRLLANVFRISAHNTWLSQELRMGMMDGLTSWFYGFIAADMCKAPLEMERLRLMSGSDTQALKDFNQQAKTALDLLQAKGVITSYRFDMGSKGCARRRSRVNIIKSDGSQQLPAKGQVLRS